jgi:hypothetical protein
MKHPDLEEKPMLTRTSIFALAAVLGLGATALVPTSATARGGGGFGHGGGFAHASSVHRSMGHGPIVKRSANLSIKPGLHKISPKLPMKAGLKSGPKFAKHWPNKHWCHHHHCSYYPWWYVGSDYVVDIEPGTAVVENVAASVAAPVQRTDTCNCLTKQYLPDGAVLFTDVCTKEEALATPEQLKAQAQGPGPGPGPRLIPR